jgi:hypothetical protein
MLVLRSERLNWRVSPPPILTGRSGTSLKLKRECRGYVPTQYFPASRWADGMAAFVAKALNTRGIYIHNA